jgi:hypothetical protein
MRPIAPSEPDLGRYSGSTVIVACIRCKRLGAYKTKGLAERFGPETFLTDVPQRVAESRGCSPAATFWIHAPTATADAARISMSMVIGGSRSTIRARGVVMTSGAGEHQFTSGRATIDGGAGHW